VRQDGDGLVLEFETLVGPPAKWRSVGKFPDPDTYQFAIYGEKDGKWQSVVTQTLNRKKPSSNDPTRQVTEAVVDAPADAVWKAFTSKEGMESWMVAHAEIDLKVGGRMLTHYSPEGMIGDPNTIENVILAYEPQRMFAMRIGKPPQNFPYKEAAKSVWHVLTFEDAGPNRTRVRAVGLGYGADEESQKMRKFFESGNAYTLKKLQEHFTKMANPGR